MTYGTLQSRTRTSRHARGRSWPHFSVWHAQFSSASSRQRASVEDGEYIEQFLTEMRADERFAGAAEGISAALEAVDREADGSPDAAAFFECVRWVLERPKPIAEKLDVLRRLMDLQGRVTVNMAIFTGWK